MENENCDATLETTTLIPVELRLYYDENGKLICYTTEKLKGNYIVIDAMTYAEARPDIRVVDGSLIKNVNIATISKLVPKLHGDISCSKDDITIIVNEPNIEITKWSIVTSEYG